MTRRRFIADEVSGDRAALTGEHAGHLVRVLRARVGQEFDIATGSDANSGSNVRRGRISRIAGDRVEFELGGEVSAAGVLRLTLVLAIFKFDRMEWAIEKCTELGVSRIVPVIARRTDAHLAAASIKRVERWRRIALQAAEQSRRAAPPEIATPVEVGEVTAGAGLRIALAESEAPNAPAGSSRLRSGCKRNHPRDRSGGRLDRRRASTISASRMDLCVAGQHDPARGNRRDRRHSGCDLHPGLDFQFQLWISHLPRFPQRAGCSVILSRNGCP